jgi:hypothetical protein
MSDPIAATREVQEKIGRNLLWIQLIEQRLKVYLSFLESNGNVRLEGMTAELEKLRKQTFGHLVNRLRETHDSRGELWLKQVVDSRNELTHHFVERFGVELFGSVVMPTVNEWLDQQRLDLRALYGMVSNSLAALLATLRETTYRDDDEMKQLLRELARKFCTGIGNTRVEVVIQQVETSEPFARSSKPPPTHPA